MEIAYTATVIFEYTKLFTVYHNYVLFHRIIQNKQTNIHTYIHTYIHTVLVFKEVHQSLPVDALCNAFWSRICLAVDNNRSSPRTTSVMPFKSKQYESFQVTIFKSRLLEAVPYIHLSKYFPTYIYTYVQT